MNFVNTGISVVHRSTKSQVYPLIFGSQKVPVYCHMGSFGCGDGGWTLAMKIDGKKVCYFAIKEYHCCKLYTTITFLFSTFQKTFHYDSKFWSDKNVFNLPGGKTGFDSEETKLPTYWNTPFSKICLGHDENQPTAQVYCHQQASKLSPLTDRRWKIPQHCTGSQLVEDRISNSNSVKSMAAPFFLQPCFAFSRCTCAS